MCIKLCKTVCLQQILRPSDQTAITRNKYKSEKTKIQKRKQQSSRISNC